MASSSKTDGTDATAGHSCFDNSDSDSGEETEPTIIFVDRLNDTQPARVLVQVLESAVDEDIIKNSTLGPAILTVIEHLLQTDLEGFATELVRELYGCMLSSRQGPSSIAVPVARVWRNFHCLRLSTTLQSLWQPCYGSLQLPQDLPNVSDMVLQIILTRTMHVLIRQVTEVISDETPQHPVADLTTRELNAIRYMGGYVIMKLTAKYKKRTSPSLQAKHRKYVEMLSYMKAKVDDSGIDSLHDYTRIWVEQVDRGGLCHIRDEVLTLFQEIELVCRRFLDTRTVPQDHILSKIEATALSRTNIITMWKDLITSDSIPDQESAIDDINLLKEVIRLWSTIRVHSFAEGWTDKYQKSFLKATRTTLKRKNTPKDSTQ